MRPRILVSVALVLLAACDSGIQLGAACERSGQCVEPLACVLGRCRTECVENRDCPLESECVLVSGAGVCRLPTDVCTSDSECPAPLVCGADGVCRATCTSDAECAGGSRCALSEGRLVCVRGEDAPDAGADAGADAGTDGGSASACDRDENAFFANGLSGWCVETSDASLVDRVTIASAGIDGHALAIDLEGAPAGAWARVYQELPLDETRGDSFTFAETIARESGAVLVALEAVDASGAVIGRAARGTASADLASPCDATGRSGHCETFDAGRDIAIDLRALGRVGTDLRQVVAVRRVIEVIAGPASHVRAVLDGIGRNEPTCPLAWWRVDGADVLEERLDRPITGLAPGLAWTGPIVPFVAGACGLAIAFDGSTHLDRAAPIDLAAGPITIELAWHAPQMGPFPITGTRVLVEQLDGDLSLAVRAGRLTARLGRCGSAPALEAVDVAPVVADDRRFQDLAVVADWSAPRVCLVREGVTVACDTTPDCTLGAPGTAGWRIGAGAGTGTGWTGALDELRIRSGDHGPRDPSTSTGICHLDQACTSFGHLRVRDVGSDGCVDPGACTAIAPCREHARDPGLSCGAAGRVPCALAPECFEATAECGGGCVPSAGCEDDIAPACP